MELSNKELMTALAKQYIKMGMDKPWGDDNEYLNIARELMETHDITGGYMASVCGMSEVHDNLKELEKTAYLQGNKFLTSINGVIYIADYDMNLESY